MINKKIPPQSAAAGDGHDSPPERELTLKKQEWRALEDVAMSFHGVMRLIDAHGFDNSSGAEELLGLAYKQLEKVLASVRERMDEEAEEKDTDL
ncbi:MAG TPA: hypothetical protein VLV83_23505 [Acidobacteriota bacterium]|nr:hypothetical protein [Acidobacteriota bacterium]